ncbi:MAG: lytic murein transglycosylase [Pseudomonadota bacterium]|nr:lytic murein transglycosylase [Pseudomonadota bacterium]
MTTFLALLNFLLPPATDCYLQPDILDPHTSQELKKISFEVSSDTGISIKDSQNLLRCIQNNHYTKSRNQSETASVQPIKGAASKKTPSLFSQFNKRLVDPYRVKQGVLFYQKYEQILENAENRFGVDPYVITAIIGAESNYGRFTGSHIIKDSLATVIANTPSDVMPPFSIKAKPTRTRKQYFVDQLKALVKISLKTGFDIQTLKGSWDGGLGLAQFMPESYQDYAISSKNHYPDLFDPEDAILSIANYLAKKGHWKPGPVASLLPDDNHIKTQLGSQQSIPYQAVFNLKDMSPYQDNPDDIYQFIQADGSSQYWLTYANFNAIRSYNPRPHYAINIHILTEAIKQHV